MATDELPDVKTLIVAPINGYVEGERSMIGILYVTSPHHVFSDMHAFHVMALADLLGMVYPGIMVGFRPDSQEGG